MNLSNQSFFKANDRVLFQGDSITHAFRKPEEVGTSYQLGAGWVMIIAAQIHAQWPDLNIQFENRGVCGEGATELLTRWECDCLDLKPDVLSLLIGVNDTCREISGTASRPLAAYRTEVDELLSKTKEANPDVRLVLCDPFILEVKKVDARWRDDITGRQAIIKDLARQYAAVHVPMQSKLDEAAQATGGEYWLFDGVHPNASAQWLMAQTWLGCVL